MHNTTPSKLNLLNAARRSLVLIIATTTLAMGLAFVTATPASSATTAPRTKTYTDSGPDYLSSGDGYTNKYPKTVSAGDWTKHGTNCGFWGCHGGDHYFTDKKGATAWWFLPDLQGEYRLDIKFPKGTNGGDRESTARVRYKVWEKRTGKNNYSVVATYTTSQQGLSGWLGWARHVQLDGKVLISAEVLSGYAGVADVKLTFKDLLPEMIPSAKKLCEVGVIEALKPWVAVPTAVAAAVVVVYAAPIVLGGGKAALTLRAAQALKKVIPGVTVEDLVKDEIQDLVIEKVTSYLTSELGSIWDEAVESYQYGCDDFRASWMYLGITRGYGNYADDLAEIWSGRRS